MDRYKNIHILQSDEWGEFKSSTGKEVVKVSSLQFTKHKIPYTKYYVGYAPKVNFYAQRFGFKELRKIAKSENVVLVRFDTPNVIQESTEKNKQYESILRRLEQKTNVAPKNNITRYNILLDIRPSVDSLIRNMNQKTRYNVRLSDRKGVKVHLENDEEGFNIFYQLHKDTAARQGFMIHNFDYYQKCFNTLKKHNMVNILIARYENAPLAAYMLFNYKDTAYYTHGGSATVHRKLMASNLLMWESIKLAKKIGCTCFDMWGATNNKEDDFWGFTKFKLGYGGTMYRYMSAYDFVINPLIYHFYNISYNTAFKLNKAIRFRKLIKDLHN